jgi:hypothetical protein
VEEPAEARADTASLFVVPSDAGEDRRAGRRRKREPAASAPEPAVATPDDAPDTDPFQGPLRVPLLAPLLDPTAPDDSAPPAVPTPIRPVPAQPVADDPPAVAEPDGPVAAPMAGVEPEVPDEVPQEWEEDWKSGEWAMPPGGPSLSPPADGFDVFETPAAPSEGNAVEETGRTELPQRAADRPEPALPTRTRRADQPKEPSPEAGSSLFDSPRARVGPAPRPGPGDLPLFGEPQPDQAGRRRRPDPEPAEAEPSVLSSTERDLLSQLQAELADRERRPRPYRRARTPAVNGHANGHGVNGHGTDDPDPDGPEPPAPR